MKIRNDYIKKHSGICSSCRMKLGKPAYKGIGYKTRLYRIWQGLFHRRYKYPVDVCEEWNNFFSFKEWALNNGYSDNLTIDRINNKKGYSPENCQWITLEENSGKDKIIFKTLEEKIYLYNKRRELVYSQRDMAKLLKVSRNTIQRLERDVKQHFNITRYERISKHSK